MHQYGQGDPLDVVAQSVVERCAALKEAAEFVRTRGGEINDDWLTAYPVGGIRREDFQFASLALLLIDSSEGLALFRQLISPVDKKRGYLFDLLIKSFIPDYKLVKKYTVDKYAAPWTNPIVAALAQPADKRASALAAHMKNWPRLMRPYGWKPNLDTAPGKDNLFCDFAFEVALAVCAYDIDDSSFNDHPYYPRDLVEHYRAHLRQTRDAWRPQGVGAGVEITPPPPPKKADLAKSKRKNIARWVELVCDGDVDATEAVLEAVGKLRKVKDLDELMCALSENNQAIHADIKDDETLNIQASTLAEARGLGAFDGPAGPPHGPARCCATLRAYAPWLSARGYLLVDIDGQDDAWHAVLVKAEHHQELLDLSQQLGLQVRDPVHAYATGK
ncbi:MAG TPA: PoNe immunity protein domain-containing protein [Burkholderiales bacterium]|nr:PoNe immunity protein domain-containing protein [Burkholderiales bacterium]